MKALRTRSSRREQEGGFRRIVVSLRIVFNVRRGLSMGEAVSSSGDGACPCDPSSLDVKQNEIEMSPSQGFEHKALELSERMFGHALHQQGRCVIVHLSVRAGILLSFRGEDEQESAVVERGLCCDTAC